MVAAENDNIAGAAPQGCGKLRGTLCRQEPDWIMVELDDPHLRASDGKQIGQLALIECPLPYLQAELRIRSRTIHGTLRFGNCYFDFDGECQRPASLHFDRASIDRLEQCTRRREFRSVFSFAGRLNGRDRRFEIFLHRRCNKLRERKACRFQPPLRRRQRRPAMPTELGVAMLPPPKRAQSAPESLRCSAIPTRTCGRAPRRQSKVPGSARLLRVAGSEPRRRLTSLTAMQPYRSGSRS